jgi:predicted esterase YcpF (UPF0227 family)
MRPTHLLYLHGFRSSPQSAKARRVAQWAADNTNGSGSDSDLTLWCPQLPPSPRAAMALVDTGVADWPKDRMAIIGSSLGGFYATVAAERYRCPAVLLNPAVDPARDLAKHIGMTTSWHGDEAFYFDARFVDELRAMKPAALTLPERYFTVIAKGDEVLDWREMSARYSATPGLLLEGSDHALSQFDDQLPAVLRFLELD